MIYSAGIIADWALGGIASFFTGVLLFLDEIIYSFISWVYQIILILANGNLLSNREDVTALINRLYIIIGVVMMFVLAYSLLQSLVNPDNAGKDKKSPVKIITNIIISIVLIAFVPTIFDFALGFQNALLRQNTIGKIILGSTGSNNVKNDFDTGGNFMAATILQGFLHPNIDQDNCTVADGKYECPEDFLTKEGITDYNEFWNDLAVNGNFNEILNLNTAITDGRMTYYYIISTIAGVYALFVLLTYAFYMATRIVKLAVYEILAPLPILCRIVPNDKVSGVFKNWLKATVSTYLEVFIVLAVLFFGVWVMRALVNNITTIFLVDYSVTNWTLVLVAQVLLILGILGFIHEAPKLIKDITGLDSTKFNPFTMAKQGFSFIAGAVAGRSLAAGYRAMNAAGDAKLSDFTAIGNQAKRRRQMQEAKQAKKAAKARGEKVGSVMNDALRKRFGFETKLERSNRYLEEGRDMNGKYRKIINDTDADIVLHDLKGNPYRTIKKGEEFVLDKATMDALKFEKEYNAKEMAKIDEEKRHKTEGNELNKMHFDTWSNMKKEAEDKMADGDNDVFGTLYAMEKIFNSKTGQYEWQEKLDANGQKIVLEDLQHNKLENMNYAALSQFIKDNGDKLPAEELEAYKASLKKAHDDIRNRFLSREAKAHKGRTSELTTKFLENYIENGIFDAETGEQYWLDFGGTIGTDVRKLVEEGRMAEIFTAGNGVKRVKNDGTAYTGSGTTQLVGAGIDMTVKHENDVMGGELQKLENRKAPFNNESKRVDRINKAAELLANEEKASATYQAYKASDNINKINESAKK